MQQGVQTDATCNIQHWWELLANNVASICKGLKSVTWLTHYLRLFPFLLRVLELYFSAHSCKSYHAKKIIQ